MSVTTSLFERLDGVAGWRRRPDWWIVGGAVVLMTLSFVWNSITRPPDYIPRERVWAHVRDTAPEYGLEPAFVFAIIKAESTFNANASNNGARGLMQLRNPAWEMVTDRPFRHAWRWRVNVDQGIAYLAYLRDFLEERDAFSYPNLAVSYRYGHNAFARADFDMERMPSPRNEVYRAIFSGNIAPVALPGE